MSRVSISVNWPKPSGRLVSTQFYSVSITVSGSGMSDVTGTIPRGQSTPLRLNVPAGANRVFTAMSKDVGGNDLVGGKITVANLAAGSSVSVTVPIIGLDEPTNDTPTTPTNILLTAGVGKVVDVIDTKYSDSIDNLKFTGVAGKEYTVTLTGMDQPSGAIIMDLFDGLGTLVQTVSVSAEVTRNSAVFTIPVSATDTSYAVKVRVDPNVQAGIETRILYAVDVAESAQVDIGVD
jgi:hypothetical protein